MARPLVLVFQEIAQPQATPVVPDLNSIIVGPAYVLKDYPDDADEILLSSTYGQLNQPNPYAPPVSGADAVTVTSYPGNSPGAIVDKSSVLVTLKFPRVGMGATYSGAGSVFSPNCETFSTVGNENKVTLVGGVTTSFVAAGIRAGDSVILTSSLGTQTAIRTVLSVGEPDSTGVVTDANTLRLTANLPIAGVLPEEWTYNVTGELRIERVLDTQLLVDDGTFVTFPEPNTDKMVLKGGVTLGVQVGTATVQKPLSYSELYLGYRALRQDLQTIDSVTSGDIRIDGAITSFTNIGRVDARNPLAAACFVALQNAGQAPIYFFGLPSNNLAGHLVAREVAASRRDMYCFAPLTQDLNVLAAYKFEWENLASPTYALTNGVPQLFRIVLGNVQLPQATTIVQPSILGEAQIQVGSGTTKRRTLTFAGSPLIDLSQVLPGDSLTIGLVPSSGQWSSRRGQHLVSHVNTSLNVEVEPGRSAWNDTTADVAGALECRVVSPTGTVKFSRLGFVDFVVTSPNGLHIESLLPTTVGGPYRVQLLDTGAVPPTVTIAGFDITVNIDAAVTTTQQVMDAINSDPTASTIVVASLIGVSVAIPTSIPFTSLLVDFRYRDSIDSGADGIRVRLRNIVAGVTIEYNNTGAGPTVAVVGPAITVDYDDGVTMLDAIVAAINASAAASALVVATRFGANIVSTAGLDALGLQTVDVVDQTYINATVTTNDELYIRLSDTTAKFITDAVRVGDIVEIPVNPNNYTPTAFSGQLISYVVAQIVSETQLLVQNLGDDKAASATELPHGYARDIAGLLIDNSPAGSPAAAQNYRIRRLLSKDEQVLSLIASAQSLRSKRATLTFPDIVKVADLKDGSLPRTDPAILTEAGNQAGWYIEAQVAGALAGLPPQHGLTNLGLVGITRIYNSSGYFSEAQLSRLSDGGLFVMHQRTETELPFCIHQLTTDPSTIETGELSVVKNIDFVSVFLQTSLEGFLGQYNVLPETLDDILQAMNTATADLMNRSVARIGPPLLSGEVTRLLVDPNSADRVQIFFKGSVPKPLNEIDLHVIF